MTNSFRRISIVTKVACASGIICTALIAFAFWAIADAPTVAHPRAVLILGIASIGAFASLILFTGAQLIGVRRWL